MNQIHAQQAFSYEIEGVLMPNGDINRMKTAKKVVAEFMTEHAIKPPEFQQVVPDDVYIVWFSKTLQNWKALLSSDIVDTGIYFEVTYNGDKQELYLDFYVKQVNRAYSVL